MSQRRAEQRSGIPPARRLDLHSRFPREFLTRIGPTTRADVESVRGQRFGGWWRRIHSFKSGGISCCGSERGELSQAAGGPKRVPGGFCASYFDRSAGGAFGFFSAKKMPPKIPTAVRMQPPTRTISIVTTFGNFGREGGTKLGWRDGLAARPAARGCLRRCAGQTGRRHEPF